MKKLIESMDRIEECGMTEMPAMPASLPAPEMDKGNPVTVNVNMNASGKEHVADLLDMMKNAGLGGAEPVSAKMLSPRMDMERLSSIMGEPKDKPEMEEIEEGADPKLASMIAKFVDDVEIELRYFGQPDAAKVGMLIKQGNVEDAAGEMADAMTDQDGGSDKFDMVMQTAQEYIEDYMSENESYEFGSTPRKSEPRKPVSYDPKQSMPSIMKYAYQPDVSNALAKAAGVDSEEVYFDDADLVHGDKTVVPGCLVDDGCTFGDAVKALNKFVKEGDYANEPDPQYGDMSDAIPDGNDLNRKKKAYPATQDGDNPMAVEAIKAALYAALTEKKKTMVKGPDGKMVPDYAADGKGKDDLSKGKKDTKTTEGRGKVMAGRGRGKDKLMAGRGRGKKK